MSSNRILNADDIQGINIFRNYVKNDGANTNTAGWATYADAAGSIPVDGTGGSPNVTWSRVTSNPISLDGSFQFVKDAANRQGQGVSYDFTVDRGDQAKVVQIQFAYEIVSGTFVGSATPGTNSDMIVYIYDVTNSVLIQPAGILLDGSVSGQGFDYRGTFQTNSNSTSYRLILHCSTTSASAYTLNFDNFKASRQVIPNGAVVTDWQTYTPTGTWTTNTTYSGKWRRIGDQMEVMVEVSTSGAPTAANLTVNLPTGYLIDTNKFTTNYSIINTAMIGATWVNDSNASFFTGGVSYNDTSSIFPRIDNSSSTYSAPTAVSNTVPITFGSGDRVVTTFTVPIVGWSSNVQMSNDTDTRVVSSAAKTLSTTTVTSGTAIVLTTSQFDTHGAYNTSTGSYLVPVAGKYRVSFSPSYVTAGAVDFDLRVNTIVIASRFMSTNATSRGSGSAVVNVNSGDSITVTPAASNTFGDTVGSIYIERISGPAIIAASEVVAAIYIPSGTPSFSNGDVFNFATKSLDTHGAVVTGTGTAGSGWRFIAPISGLYQVSYNSQQSTSVDYNINFYKNASQGRINTSNSSMAFGIITGSGLIQLNSGDYIQPINSSGGTVTLNGNNCQISIIRVG